MTPLNEPDPSRKRIATYGKAVRKRPPNHIALKTLQDLERPPISSSVTSTTTGSRNTDSAPSASPTLPTRSFHIFDVPSSDSEATRTPQKKRKLVHIARPREATSVGNTLEMDHVVLQRVSDRIVEQVARTGGSTVDLSMGYKQDRNGPLKIIEKVQHSPESSTGPALLPSRKGCSMTSPKSSTNDVELCDRLLQNRLQQDSTVLDHPADNSTKSSNSSQAPRTQAGTCTTPRQWRLATSRNLPSRPSTPTVMDHETCDTSISLSASSILTPNGMKMWNDLLGDNTEDDLEMKKLENSAEKMKRGGDHQSIIGGRKLPRRRLIDSLVEQSKNDRPILEIYSDLEEVVLTESKMAPLSQAVEQQETSTTQFAGVQKSPEKNNTLSNVAGVGQSSQTLGAKITYSRQRSMLAEQDIAKEMDFDIPLHESLCSTKLQKRRGAIPILTPLHTSPKNAEAVDGKVGVAIRTIHELRQAGAESRFRDEVEDLLDRIGSPSQQNTTRRSGLMELAVRMRDKPFYTKSLSNGIDQRLLLHIGQEQDVVSGFILVSLFIMFLHTGVAPIIITQLCRQGISRLLIRLISVGDSILTVAKARKNNMSKLAQATLAEQHESLLQLRVWGDVRPQSVSPRTASLQCLELMVRQSREAGDIGDILSEELVSGLFNILEGSYNKGPAAANTTDFRLALSTLVSHSMNPMTGLEEYLPVIKDILEVAMQKPSESSTVAFLLRLVLNTTNSSPTASDAFASPELLRLMCRAVIEKFGLLSGFIFEDQRLFLIDNLVLMLIVMINITELSTHAHQCFLAIEDSSLDDLVMIFQDNIERAFEAESVEDSHLNVAGGYLAVLLGYLSLSPEIGQRITLRQGPSCLQPLIASIDEFISHHKKVDDLLKDDGEPNPQAGLTNRLQILVDKLKETNDT